MLDEHQSLTNPGIYKADKRYYLFVALNVAVIIFVFLAFIFSTLAYHNGKILANQVNNSYIYQQGGLISQPYHVSEDYYVTKGSVVSFCTDGKICEGLGPAWRRPFWGTGSVVPAVLGSIVQLTPSVAIFAHVAGSDHAVLRVTVLETDITTGVKQTTTMTLANNETFRYIKAVNTNVANVVAILYDTTNGTYVVAGVVGNNNTVVTIATPIRLFDNENRTWEHADIVHADSWTLVTFGTEGQGSNYVAYVVDQNLATKLSPVMTSTGGFSVMAINLLNTVYLGNGLLMQANGLSFTFGEIDFNLKTIKKIQESDFTHLFSRLQLTKLFGNLVVFSGTQSQYVDQPITIVFVVEWTAATAPYLRIFNPTNLFASPDVMPYREHISTCYIPPHPQEPYGGLFFTYVDSRSNRAKIVRSRPVSINNQLQVVSSPAFDISTTLYNRTSLLPLLACPSATNHSLIVTQDFYPIFNTFFWSGGYQYAGIAQSNGTSGNQISVIREGISSGHVGLIPGHHYYVTNWGALYPYQSTFEQFTSNGFRGRIGTALNDNQLLLEPDVFDGFNWM